MYLSAPSKSAVSAVSVILDVLQPKQPPRTIMIPRSALVFVACDEVPLCPNHLGVPPQAAVKGSSELRNIQEAAPHASQRRIGAA